MTNEEIKLNNNQVKSSLAYMMDEDTVVFNIEKDSNVDLSFKGESKVIINIAKNIKADIIENLNMERLDINYKIAQDAQVSIFTKPDSDDKEMILNKHLEVAKNSEVEVSNALFNDNSMEYDFRLDLNGPEAQGIHNMAIISLHKNQNLINVRINNNAKNTTGIINNFGVVKNKATLIFNGTGYIAKKAIQAKAHQASKIITFDEGVTAQANPYLLINENDVEASHAAAVGRMDEEQLFYMQSRGIDFENASKLITYGYLKPVLTKIKNVELRLKLEKVIEEKVGFDV